MQYIYRGQVVQYYFEPSRIINFLTTLQAIPMGFRKLILEIFFSPCRIVRASYMIMYYKSANTYIRATGKKCNRRTRRHCVCEVDFHMRNIQNKSAIFNSACKYQHLNDDAREYENRFPSINFVFPIHAVV